MGGKALSCNTPVCFLGLKLMSSWAPSALPSLKPCTLAGAWPMSSYREKPDAGDADILVAADERYDPFVAVEALGAVEIVRNGPATSIGVRCALESSLSREQRIPGLPHQSAPVEFDYASNLLSMVRPGNFVGRIAHASFCAHKHNGLWFYFRKIPDAPDHLFREIVLTRDYRKLWPIWALTWKRYNQGFDTLLGHLRVHGILHVFATRTSICWKTGTPSLVCETKWLARRVFLCWCEEQPNLPAFQFPGGQVGLATSANQHFPGLSRTTKKPG